MLSLHIWSWMSLTPRKQQCYHLWYMHGAILLAFEWAAQKVLAYCYEAFKVLTSLFSVLLAIWNHLFLQLFSWQFHFGWNLLYYPWISLIPSTFKEGRMKTHMIFIVLDKVEDRCKARVCTVTPFTHIIFLVWKHEPVFVSLFLPGKWTFCKLPPEGMAPPRRTVSRLILMSKICKLKLKIFS